jgi:histidine phosphotransferase ChpT
MSLTPLILGRLCVARLCHDLGGAAGTLAGTLDLLDGADPEVGSLLRDTAQVMRLRLRLYAAAWGGAAPELTGPQLVELLEAGPASPRVRFDAAALHPGQALPAPLVALALNAGLLAAEALPRGGTARLGGDAAQGITVLPVGPGAAWPGVLLRVLAGEDPAALALEAGPRAMLGPLLVLLAAEQGWSATLALGGPGAAPLLLRPGGAAG